MSPRNIRIRFSAQATMEARLIESGLRRTVLLLLSFAFGKTSEEMLAILRSRLGNDPNQELRIAAAEQAQITQLRLRKLVAI